MKIIIKKRIAGILIAALILSNNVRVFAANDIPVIDMGVFEVTTLSGDTPVKPPGGDPSKEDLDISKAKVNYTYESRFRGKPVELNIICIHEAVSGRHIPESGYRVSYLNNDRPGEATAVITGQNGYTGEQRINYKITGIYIGQAPKENDILTEYRTVVATGTKWKLTPSFNVARVRSTDTKIIKNSLKFNDVKTISMSDYITGVTYLLPTDVTSKNTKVATVSGDYSISVSANGSSRITLVYGKRKINTALTAKLPAFTRAKVTLKNKPVKLKLKNLPKNASVSFSSSDPNIVKMNPDGFAAPVSNGTVTVYARAGNVTAECTVTVKGLK